MTIQTNKKRADGIGASSTYYIWKAIGDLGHTALCAEDQSEDVDLVLNVDGHEPLPKIEGVPYFAWDCDSFINSLGGFFHPPPTLPYDRIFIGGAPEDLERYPEGTVFLPHACDPQIHRSLPEVEKTYDIVMIGNMSELYKERKRLVSLLRSKFTVLELETEFGEPYVYAMNQGKLIFNRSLGENNIPMRFFEGMAIGTLLHNDTGNLAEFATPYAHFIPYKTDAELLENAEYYLKNDDVRQDIAFKARQLVLKHHTYMNRVATILSYL